MLRAVTMLIPAPTVLFLAFIAPIGCRDRENRTDPPPASASSLQLITPAHAAPERALTPPPIASHAYVHGSWSSCANGFRTSNQPQRDVTRLSLICAPYHGMSRHGRTWLGHIHDHQDGAFDVHLRKGQCGRVFAVGPSDLSHFRVTVSSPSGAVLASRQASASFVIVNPEGAFCVNQTGAFRVRVTTEQGTGLVAAEVWTLPDR